MQDRTFGGSSEGAHLSNEVWERLALGGLDPGGKERALEHVSRCTECARILRGLLALEREALAAVPDRVAVLTAPKRDADSNPWLTVAAAVAAAGLFAMSASIVLAPPMSPAPSSERSENDRRPRAIRPLGAQEAPPQSFLWETDGSGHLFTLELLDERGERIWRSGELSRPETSWPREIPPRPGRYYWRVWSADEDGTLTASRMTAFEIPP